MTRRWAGFESWALGLQMGAGSSAAGHFSELMDAGGAAFNCATETWLEDGSIESWARSVYLRYNPEKAGDLEALLAKYHGREDQLLCGIREKYSVPVPSHLAHFCKSEPTERVEKNLRRTTKA